MPWNNGAWWPIYVPQWWSPIVSRHPLSFIFEIIENARCTIEKYRENSGTSSDYDG